MSKIQHMCPPYKGKDPYLLFCFSEKDSEAVLPLFQSLYTRGVRIWYNLRVTANARKLAHRTGRIKGASLMVVYVSDNARQDPNLKNTALFYQSPDKPIIAIDTDDKGKGLDFGLTVPVRHINGRLGRNREDLEADLIHTEGFTQQLIGEPQKVRNLRKKLAAVFLAFALLMAGGAYAGYRWLGWFTVPIPTATPGPETTDTSEQTPEPSKSPDTVSLEEKDFTDDVRKATSNGVITKETIAEIEELDLRRLPEDITLLEKLPNLKKIRIPQSEAANVMSRLEGDYTVILMPEEVTGQ